MENCSDAAPIEAGPPTSPRDDQPYKRLQRDGCEFVVLGTAHVSQSSVDAVEAWLAAEPFDHVAVELCASRYQAVTRPDSLGELDLFRVIQEGKVGLVAANLALSAYQRRLAEQLGVEPGAEMRAAIQGAEARGLPVWKIDRDVGTTLRRTYQSVGWWQRTKLMAGLLGSVVVNEEVEAHEIENLKKGDMLESTFSEFASRSDKLFRSMIGERDEYMAASLREQAAATQARRVLAVVGAGHLAGIERCLREDRREPGQLKRELSALKPPGRWGLVFSLIFAALVIGGFVWGFASDAKIGTELVIAWILATGGLGAVGCTLAGGHPLSILTAFAVSPLTPLHPFLASGMVSALVETTVRKPTVGDFARLRDDVTTVKGWWRNRVSRVLLNFFLTNLGTALGVYLAGWRMLETLL